MDTEMFRRYCETSRLMCCPENKFVMHESTLAYTEKKYGHIERNSFASEWQICWGGEYDGALFADPYLFADQYRDHDGMIAWNVSQREIRGSEDFNHAIVFGVNLVRGECFAWDVNGELRENARRWFQAWTFHLGGILEKSLNEVTLSRRHMHDLPSGNDKGMCTVYAIYFVRCVNLQGFSPKTTDDHMIELGAAGRIRTVTNLVNILVNLVHRSILPQYIEKVRSEVDLCYDWTKKFVEKYGSKGGQLEMVAGWTIENMDKWCAKYIDAAKKEVDELLAKKLTDDFSLSFGNTNTDDEWGKSSATWLDELYNLEESLTCPDCRQLDSDGAYGNCSDDCIYRQDERVSG